MMWVCYFSITDESEICRLLTCLS